MSGELCVCRHVRSDHIHEEGACRPGFVCPGHCVEFRAAPLRVVIDLSEEPAPSDPAGRTEAHHLIDMLRETAENFFVPDAAALARKVADQIERQVGPRKPPKPEEPTGWLAAVEDRGGNRWAIAGGPTDGDRRWYSPDLNTTRAYADIAAVRVLSEGVTEDGAR